MAPTDFWSCKYLDIRQAAWYRATFEAQRRSQYLWKVIDAEAVLEIVFPSSLIACATGVGIDPQTLLFAIPPIASVDAAVHVGVLLWYHCAALRQCEPGNAGICKKERCNLCDTLK